MKKSMNLPYVLMLVFIGLSILLSLKYKKAKDELTSDGKSGAIQERNLEAEYNFRLGAFRQLLEFNLHPTPQIIEENLRRLTGGNERKVVLYLKRDGCSACNIGVVGWALRNFLENEGFYVFLHPENEFFLQTTAHNEDIDNHERVIVSTTQLYPHPPRGYAYDAEFLFLDHNNRVTGIIPLDYLKVEGLFDGFLEQYLGN